VNPELNPGFGALRFGLSRESLNFFVGTIDIAAARRIQGPRINNCAGFVSKKWGKEEATLYFKKRWHLLPRLTFKEPSTDPTQKGLFFLLKF
jgi:hypothetical protein